MHRPQRPPRKITQDDKIAVVIKGLLEKEKDDNGLQTKASTQPYSDDKLEKWQKNLDSLARLSTGDEICVALCFYNNNFIIASNKNEPIYARKFLPLLQNYMLFPFKDNYTNLEVAANYQIQLIIDKIPSNNVLLRLTDEAECYNDLIFIRFAQAIGLKDIPSVKDLGEKIIESKFSIPEAKKFVIDIIRPLIDIRIITNLIFALNESPKCIIEAIKNGNYIYITESSKIHAEMKILDYLHNKILDENYLGISKLACWPCNALLVTFNNEFKNILKFSGTHGGTYPNWEPPKWLLLPGNEEIKEKFLGLLESEPGKYWKDRETYPYLDDFIPKAPVLSSFKDLREAESQLEICKEEINNAKKRLAEHEETFEQFNKRKNDIDKQIIDIKSNISDKDNERKNLDKNLLEQRTKNIAAESKIQRAEKDFESLKRMKNWSEIREFLNNSYRDVMDKVRSELRSKKDDKSKIDCALKAFKNKYKINDSKSNINQNNDIEKVKNIEQEIKSLNANIKPLQAESDKLDKQIEEAEKEIISLKKKIPVIKDNIDNLTENLKRIKYIFIDDDTEDERKALNEEIIDGNSINNGKMEEETGNKNSIITDNNTKSNKQGLNEQLSNTDINNIELNKNIKIYETENNYLTNITIENPSNSTIIIGSLDTNQQTQDMV